MIEELVGQNHCLERAVPGIGTSYVGLQPAGENKGRKGLLELIKESRSCDTPEFSRDAYP